MPEIDFYHKRGFTLIEVLISMIILAIGLLGMAMMQGRALKTNKDAYLYGQANLLAYEMADRIRANAVYWKTNIPTPAVGNSCDSSADNCTAAAMAAYDYYRWQTDAINLLPGVTTTTNLPVITRVTAGTATTVCPYNNNPTSLCLTIQWTRTDSSSTITHTLQIGSTTTTTTTASQQLGITL